MSKRNRSKILMQASPHTRMKVACRLGMETIRGEWRDRMRKKIKKCPRCGCRMKKGNGPDSATVDHIVPLSKGGHDVQSNWQVMCKKCNLAKGNKLESDK